MRFLPVHFVSLFVVLVLTMFLYTPSLKYPFLAWDDEGHVTQNRHVKDLRWESLGPIFTSSVNQTYIPLTILSFAIETRLAGGDASVYRTTNLVLHLAVVVLICQFALALGCPPWGAVIAALIFAVHPMHVESVAWITQRKDVLYSFFYVLGLITYVRYVRDQKWIFLGLTALCGFLSILSKPMAMSFPLILFLVDWLLGRRRDWSLVWEKIPVALPVFSIAWITYAMNMRAIDFLFPQSFLAWIWCFVFYIRKFLVPCELMVLYQLPKPVSFLNPEFGWSIAGVVLIVGVVIWLKKYRWVSFAALYYLLSIFFLLRFDDHQDLTFVADRFMYLPSAGLCICVGWALTEIYGRWGRSASVLCLVGVLLTVTAIIGFRISIDRVKVWGNEERMWTQVIEHYPNAVAFTQLGNIYLNRGRLDKAEEYYAKAMYVNSRYSKPFANYALLLTQQGDFGRAIGFLTRAIELEQKPSAVLLGNRGYVYMRLGRTPEALADFNRALAADVYYVPAYLNRATLYKNQQDHQLAMQDLERVLQIDPGNAKAVNNVQLLRRLMTNERKN